MLIAVTDHAAERFRQRVGGRLGEVDVRGEIVGRVSRAWAAGRAEADDDGTVRVRDLVDRALVFVCRHERAARELVVVTLWERQGGPAPPRVPRRFTDALDDPRGRA
jgi:hypothetical protein